MEAVKTREAPTGFDLIEYARKHRYRVRNIHDGGPVPPARRKRKPTKPGHVGAYDRSDAIVGQRGYLTAEDGGLGICLFFKSGRGVALAKAEIKALDGQVTQEGDCELAAWLPIEKLDAALKVIRVSKLHPGNPNPPRPGKGLAVQKRRKYAVAVAGSRIAGIGG